MLKRLRSNGEFESFLRDNQDQLMLVKFFTVWCGPCKNLQENIEKLLEEKKDLVVLEIDAEMFPELAQRPDFNVYSVPTIFLFWKGKMLKKNSGNMSVQQLKEFLAVE